MSNATRISVARESEVPEGGTKTVCLNRRSVLICKSDGEFYAIANECSHAFQALEGGRIRNGWIACPAHGAKFDLKTGSPITPPATEAVSTFPVEVVDGIIFIDISGIA